jgi:hypothetical protein
MPRPPPLLLSLLLSSLLPFLSFSYSSPRVTKELAKLDLEAQVGQMIHLSVKKVLYNYPDGKSPNNHTHVYVSVCVYV